MTREREAQLIAAVLAGDPDSFEPFVTEHQTRIYNLALRMTGSPDDAFDLSQDAFIKAYESLKDFRGDSAFGSWLYRLASNLCIDFLRKRKKQNVVPIYWSDEDGETRELEIADLRYSPENEAQRAELRRGIEKGLAALPPMQRQMIVMRDVSGLSYAEIAQALSLELGTVKSRISRARAKLMLLLERDGTFCGPEPSKSEKGG